MPTDKKQTKVKETPKKKGLRVVKNPKYVELVSRTLEIEDFIVKNYPDHRVEAKEKLDKDSIYLAPTKIINSLNQKSASKKEKEKLLEVGLYKFDRALLPELKRHSQLTGSATKRFSQSAYKRDGDLCAWSFCYGERLTYLFKDGLKDLLDA